MSDPEEALLLSHEADGIKELDNKLPRWWVWLFYITIIFSIGYLLFYHVFGFGLSSAERYEKDMKAAAIIKEAAAAKFQAAMETMEPSKDPAVLAQGQKTFLTLCSPCHRADAGGLVGPNLTDDYWIHGGEFKDNLRTITDGNPIKGMIAWKGQLKPDEIYAVASYIYTLRGSNPPNPKPPENQVTPAAAAQPSEYE